MAKKKKTSKETEKNNFNYSVELIGLLLIVIGIIGFGFGLVGAIIKKFAMFLVGEWWALILIVVLGMGICMLVNRKLPNFFTSKLMGFYILLLVALVASHFKYINLYEAGEIITKTLDNYQSRIATMGTNASIFTSGQSNINIGGGILGAGVSFVLANLFGKIGTIVVLVALSVFGIVMLFDVNLSEVFLSIKTKFLARREREDDDEDDYDDEEDAPISLDNVKTSVTVNEKVDLTTRIPIATPVTVASEIKEETAMLPKVEPVATKRGIYTIPSLNLLDEVPKVGKVNSTEFTKSNKIILFLDPDYPGERIRKIILNRVPNCYNVFIKKSKAIDERKHKMRRQFLQYRLSILKFFNRDPYRCPKCNVEMIYACEIIKGG